jgi:hypothetical protein
MSWLLQVLSTKNRIYDVSAIVNLRIEKILPAVKFRLQMVVSSCIVYVLM